MSVHPHPDEVAKANANANVDPNASVGVYPEDPEPPMTVVNPMCPLVAFIIGWFFFPAWWAGCCMMANPAFGTTGRVINIISTVLGILFAIWVPILLIVLITTAQAVEEANDGDSGGGRGDGCGFYCS